MNIIDIAIILMLLMSGIVGFKKGVIKETVYLVGTILVFYLAFILRGPLADIFCTFLPFFDFKGTAISLPVLNILLYQILAFVLIAGILFTILNVVLAITGIVQKVVDLTIILTLPSKILGFVVGLFAGYIFMFMILLVVSIPLNGVDLFRDSELKDKILYKTPVLTKSIGGMSKSVEEVYILTNKVIEDDNAKTNQNLYNLSAMNIMLEHKLVSVKQADKIVKSGKLDSVTGIDAVIDDYR